MYINMVLGNQSGFRNITSQIQNVSSEMQMTRDEVLGRFNNLNASLIQHFPEIFNNSGIGKDSIMDQSIDLFETDI